ncbi:hypothetical protein G7050_16025 [Dysgonomonas sp. HDW5A]|uniref:hypothetical protein n=1 Tax=Dysgonomonas sp. HDW5A TaxID=2714926 RepID=UPI0014084067|nr:hypothetical protein [Dysgonomonas sp. HDW5A]QIK61262.1 hypothetical protein G7050_16025 [Dysgonomonas sp. HDW5A]
MKFIKQLFCEHEYQFVRNIYGDEINFFNARSLWRCPKCGKYTGKSYLINKENHE